MLKSRIPSFRQVLDFVHRQMHAQLWVSNLDRPLTQNQGAFEDYLDYFHHSCRETATWMGKTADKFPNDAWIYQEIICETKPDVVLEIGNLYGGSTLFLANMLDILNKGRVIGVDIDHSRIDFTHPRIHWVTGDAKSERILSQIARLIEPDDKVMVIEDSSHTYENTLSILRKYNRFVTQGMYFIVEDGLSRYPFIENGPKPGPYEAVHAFLKENRDFVLDKSREKFVLTYNPDGYLRRI